MKLNNNVVYILYLCVIGIVWSVSATACLHFLKVPNDLAIEGGALAGIIAALIANNIYLKG